MPLYEYSKNATNHVTVPAQVQQEMVCGTESVLRRMISLMQDKRQAGRAPPR